MVACEAFRAFGKGRHPVGLNDGELFAYALAKLLGGGLPFDLEDRVEVASGPHLGQGYEWDHDARGQAAQQIILHVEQIRRQRTALAGCDRG